MRGSSTFDPNYVKQLEFVLSNSDVMPAGADLGRVQFFYYANGKKTSFSVSCRRAGSKDKGLQILHECRCALEAGRPTDVVEALREERYKEMSRAGASRPAMPRGLPMSPGFDPRRYNLHTTGVATPSSA